MKLNKDQKQKLALGGMIVVGVIYAYFQFLLGPLQAAKRSAASGTAAIEPKIAAAKAQIAKTEALKKQAPEADKLMKQVNALIPDGSPIAWFPPRMTEFFKKHGIEKVTCRMNTETVDKALVNYRRLNWGIEMPKVDFLAFGAAVSALENAEPLIEIQTFDVEAGREDVGTQRAALGVTNLIRL